MSFFANRFPTLGSSLVKPEGRLSAGRALVREKRVPKGQQTVKVESLHRLHGAPVLDTPRERGQACGVQRGDDRDMQERQVAEPIAQPVVAHRRVWIDFLLLRQPRDRRPLVAELVDELEWDTLA